MLILTQEPNPAPSYNPAACPRQQGMGRMDCGMGMNPCSPHPALSTLAIHPPHQPPAGPKSPGGLQQGGIHGSCLLGSGSCWWAGNNSHMSTKAEEHDVYC